MYSVALDKLAYKVPKDDTELLFLLIPLLSGALLQEQAHLAKHNILAYL